LSDGPSSKPPEPKGVVCALRMCASGSSPKALTECPVILLAAKNRDVLRLFVHRDLDAIVSEPDRVYLRELICDLSERALSSAEDVFKQLCGLSSGLLQADEVVFLDASEASIQRLYPDLQPA
jgi:hypothetical protein